MISNLSSTMRYITKLQKAHSSWIQGKVRLDYQPFEFVIEPTNYCNLRCVKCVHGNGMKRRKEYLDMGHYRLILSKIYRHAESIFFTGGGEPTLHSELYQMIKEAKQQGIKRTWLLTNGTMLKPIHFPKIIDSGLDNLEFTLDGTDKETHEKIAIGSSFENMVYNIRSFLQYKKSVKADRPFTSIKIIRYSSSQPLTVDRGFLKKFRGLPVDRVYVNSLTYHSEYSRRFLENDEFVGLNRDSILNSNWKMYYPCLTVYMQVMISCSGDVIACCGDLEGINVIGNLLDKKTSISTIWNNEAFQGLRRRLIIGQLIPPCTICSGLWRGKPKPRLFDNLLLVGRIPLQMIRDFYPGIAKSCFTINRLNRLTGE